MLLDQVKTHWKMRGGLCVLLDGIQAKVTAALNEAEGIRYKAPSDQRVNLRGDPCDHGVTGPYVRAAGATSALLRSIAGGDDRKPYVGVYLAAPQLARLKHALRGLANLAAAASTLASSDGLVFHQRCPARDPTAQSFCAASTRRWSHRACQLPPWQPHAGGICTVESSRVDPLQRGPINRHAPMTGRVVLRGNHAVQMRSGTRTDDETFTPRYRALDQPHHARPAIGWADATVISPSGQTQSTRAPESDMIARRRNREPMRIKTSSEIDITFLPIEKSLLPDVSTELQCHRSGIAETAARRGHGVGVRVWRRPTTVSTRPPAGHDSLRHGTSYLREIRCAVVQAGPGRESSPL